MLAKDQFLVIIKEIDQELSKNSLAFHLRPSKAFSMLIAKVCPNLPVLLDYNKKIAHDDFSTNSLYTQVNRWYTEMYGDRIKVHMGPGKYVLMIKGEPWEVEYPLIYGTLPFTISSDLKMGSSNILCQVKNITAKISSELTDIEKKTILDEYMFGFNALELLRVTLKLPYMNHFV